jgi:hypothetical protein
VTAAEFVVIDGLRYRRDELITGARDRIDNLRGGLEELASLLDDGRVEGNEVASAALDHVLQVLHRDDEMAPEERLAA